MRRNQLEAERTQKQQKQEFTDEIKKQLEIAREKASKLEEKRVKLASSSSAYVILLRENEID